MHVVNTFDVSLQIVVEKLEKEGNLSKEMIESYIEKIEVYDEQHIEIQWTRRKENHF